MTVVVLTGATRGIGRAAAIELARRGADVVLVGRDPERVRLVAEEATAAGGGRRVHGHVADLSLMSNVRVLADEIRGHHEHVDVVANNAGALFASRKETSEGLEQTFALNHLAPFLLTNLLRDRLGGGRVVTTASGAHRSGRLDLDDLQSEKSYSPRVYGTSKLCNILVTRELARRAPELHANCFHPGVVRTGFRQERKRNLESHRYAGCALSSAPRSAAPTRWSGSPYPTTPPPSPGSTSKTNRWSPPATRPRTPTSHGACGNKAPSSLACLPTRAPNAPAHRPLLSFSGIRPRPSRVLVCAAKRAPCGAYRRGWGDRTNRLLRRVSQPRPVGLRPEPLPPAEQRRHDAAADPRGERFPNRTQAATPPVSGDTRANTNAGVGPALTRDVLVATSRSRSGTSTASSRDLRSQCQAEKALRCWRA